MRKLAFVLASLLTILLPTAVGYRIGTGYWPGTSSSHMSEGASQTATVDTTPTAKRRVLYWKDPDGKSTFSANPTKTADGRDYVAVHEDEEPLLAGDKPAAAPSAAAESNAKGERKIKLYRNPMGLPDTSPTPKKDWMGMDYIPVYEGEDEEDGSSVKVSLDKVQRSGVRTEAAELRSLLRPVKSSAVAAYDERTLHSVALRADGFIEKLYIEENGRHVKAGEPLFRVYSSGLVNAQVDYRIALSSDKSTRDRAASLSGAEQKLKNFEIPRTVIDEIERTGQPVMAIDWPSPADGVVMKKNVVEGRMVRMGEELFMLADLTKIWVIADVAEQDIRLVKIGQPARVHFKAFPGETFEGKVTFILPELEMATRTAKVRIEIDNPDYLIKPEMFADVEIDSGAGDTPRVAVPNTAVINSGDRQVVIVARGEGRFEPRAVELGLRGEGYTEISSGIAPGEEVVVSANFLIDAESNLKAALSGFTADTAAPIPPKSEGVENPERMPATEGVPNFGAAASPSKELQP